MDFVLERHSFSYSALLSAIGQMVRIVLCFGIVWGSQLDPWICECVPPVKGRSCSISKDNGRPLPKFGEWDVNDPASAEGFTVIFNKARDEKKTGTKPESPGKVDLTYKHVADSGKSQSKKWFCCVQPAYAES